MLRYEFEQLYLIVQHKTSIWLKTLVFVHFNNNITLCILYMLMFNNNVFQMIRSLHFIKTLQLCYLNITFIDYQTFTLPHCQNFTLTLQCVLLELVTHCYNFIVILFELFTLHIIRTLHLLHVGPLHITGCILTSLLKLTHYTYKLLELYI